MTRVFAGVLVLLGGFAGQHSSSAQVFQRFGRTVRTSQRDEAVTITSISLTTSVGIFGGYYFYSDSSGWAVLQDVRMGDKGLMEERTVLRGRPDLFRLISAGLRPTDFVQYRKPREYGIPDELRMVYTFRLSNGAEITAWGWANEIPQPLADVSSRIRSVRDTMAVAKAARKIKFDEKDFANPLRILRAEERREFSFGMFGEIYETQYAEGHPQMPRGKR